MHNIYKQDLLNMALRTRNRFVGGSAAMCFFVCLFSSFFAPNVFALDLDGKALAVAEQVHTGRIVCELGNVVNITPDAQNRGFFTLQMGKHRIHVSPVLSATGAIR